jgi:uncharacterized DUF497 family protein
MADLRFTWDSAQAKANLTKHGVSFAEAQTVFLDERARLIEDPEHSHEARRATPRERRQYVQGDSR